MPLAFSARLDGTQATRHFSVSLTIFFLRQAQAQCIAAANATDGEEAFKQSLTSIIYCCMFLEAFANEWAENKYSGEELERFIQQRKEFAAEDGISKATAKLRSLFRNFWSVDLEVTDSPLREIEELFTLRNEMIHYKVSKSAGKILLKAGEVQISPMGYVVNFNVTGPVVETEDPLFASVNVRTAVNSYNAALELALMWNEKAGAPSDALGAFTPLSMEKRPSGMQKW